MDAIVDQLVLGRLLADLGKLALCIVTSTHVQLMHKYGTHKHAVNT